MKFRLADIDPNPWRHMERYPIRREKVDALKESIATTDWWNNVVARLAPGDPTHAQLAYGHHRRQALLELYPLDYEVDLNIRDLSDELMIKMMARENMEEWGSSAAAQHETVRTIVEAFADGKIIFPRHKRGGMNIPATKKELPLIECITSMIDSLDVAPSTKASYRSVLTTHITPAFQDRTLGSMDEESVYSFLEGMATNNSSSTVRHAQAMLFRVLGMESLSQYGGKVRIAPSFIVRDISEVVDLHKAYTIRDIADFTGWQQKDGAPQWKVKNALDVLEVIELNLLSEDDFDGISSWQAGEVANKAKQELKARQQLANLEPRPEIKERIISEGKADASDLAKHIIGDLRSKERGQVRIEESAVASGKMTPRPNREPPHIDTFAERMCTTLNNLLARRPGNRQVKNLDLFLEFQDKASFRSRKELDLVLRQLASRVLEFADQIKKEDERPTTISGEVIHGIERAHE